MILSQSTKEKSTLIEIPIAGPIPKIDPHTNATRHVDCALGTESRRRVLRYLLDGLQGVPLKDGGTVKSPPDVIRYLLDCVAESAGLAE